MSDFQVHNNKNHSKEWSGSSFCDVDYQTGISTAEAVLKVEGFGGMTR